MSLLDCQQDMTRFWTALTQHVCRGQRLLSSLYAARESLHTDWARGVVDHLAADVQSGLRLFEAMKKQPVAFSKAAVCFLEGAEYAWIPDRVLKFILESMSQCPTCGCWQMPREAAKA